MPLLPGSRGSPFGQPFPKKRVKFRTFTRQAGEALEDVREVDGVQAVGLGDRLVGLPEVWPEGPVVADVLNPALPGQASIDSGQLVYHACCRDWEWLDVGLTHMCSSAS